MYLRIIHCLKKQNKFFSSLILVFWRVHFFFDKGDMILHFKEFL